MTITAFDAELVAFAERVGSVGPVAARGHGTRWTVGGGLRGDPRLLPAPGGVVAHVPDEMTVTVRAGTAVSDLHAELAEAGQRTALPERGGTVGGALAVGESGVHRLGRGHVREALLQARYVSADGRIVTAGGPTVKNVTGFDLCRLLVGSLGTLGLIGEVILRTQPIPGCEQWLHMGGGADPMAVRDTARTASSILWDGFDVWVHLAGHRVDVDTDRAALAQLGEPVESDPPLLPPHRWSRRPAEALTVAPAIGGSFVAEIGVGVVHAERPDEPRLPDRRLLELQRRVKLELDPDGRLGPGRRPECR